MDKGEAPKIKRKAGRPSLSSSHKTSEGLTTRSKSEPNLKESCIIWQVLSGSNRGGSSTAATSKMEHFVIIVNGWKPLTIITKSSILDVAAVLDPPLSKVKFETTGKVSKKLQDKRFFRKINNITKAENSVANGVIYHNRCYG